MIRDTFPQSLSVVLPLFNETKRFPVAFKICQRFSRRFPRWEFIFVNDGSTDTTGQLVETAIRNYPWAKLISYPKNQGKGYAIRQGAWRAQKQHLLFTDIDFSTPLNELEVLAPFLKKADLVIGTRKIKGATITKHQSKVREWLGKRFTDLTNLWLGMDISDYTCGFKLFKTETAKRLFKQQKIKRWSFDAEILFLAQKAGYRIVEIPVTWQNDERTKVNLGKDIVRSLWELWLIRWHWWRGKYKITT
jgi:glycosyltransferase involved in cell wall biosynthesis